MGGGRQRGAALAAPFADVATWVETRSPSPHASFSSPSLPPPPNFSKLGLTSSRSAQVDSHRLSGLEGRRGGGGGRRGLRAAEGGGGGGALRLPAPVFGLQRSAADLLPGVSFRFPRVACLKAAALGALWTIRLKEKRSGTEVRSSSSLALSGAFAWGGVFALQKTPPPSFEPRVPSPPRAGKDPHPIPSHPTPSFDLASCFYLSCFPPQTAQVPDLLQGGPIHDAEVLEKQRRFWQPLSTAGGPGWQCAPQQVLLFGRVPSFRHQSHGDEEAGLRYHQESPSQQGWDQTPWL